MSMNSARVIGTIGFTRRLLVVGGLSALGPALSLAACEGEPPVVAPENPPGVAPETASAAPSASEEPAATVASSAPTACPPPPCAPVAPVPSGDAAAPPAALASGAAAETAAALPVPPPSIPRGNITGAVTTKPAALQGQAVIYLEDGPTEDQPAHLQTVTIANKQMNFIPFLSVAAVGAKVVLTNEDPFPHNVFSPDNEKFNMGNIPQNGAHVRVFKNPGAYTLLCNLHPGMLGYLFVTPSAWFARTDAKGHYLMKHVPSGTYKVTAWAPRQTPVTQSVTVADGDATVNFDLHR
jgi:plastocyanin